MKTNGECEEVICYIDRAGIADAPLRQQNLYPKKAHKHTCDFTIIILLAHKTVTAHSEKMDITPFGELHVHSKHHKIFRTTKQAQAPWL